jgi:hypothetical protein
VDCKKVGRDGSTAMLDTFIIEEIKRRERGQGREDRPVLELPVPPPPPPRADRDPERPEGHDTVVIIDYTG